MDIIKYWLYLCNNEFHDIDIQTSLSQVGVLYANGMLKIVELSERKGVVAWCVVPDFKGNISVCEMLLYIKPEHRGNPRNLLTLIKTLENEAKKLHCSVRISSAFDFRDNKLLKLLVKKQYVIDSVRKEF